MFYPILIEKNTKKNNIEKRGGRFYILRAELQGLHQATCHVHDGTRFGQF